MALLSFDDLSIGFRGPPLLDGVSARIEPGQKIGLLGRNGAGKTTLLRIIEGEIRPDHGDVDRQARLKVTRLIQDVPRDVSGTIHSVVLDRVTADGDQDPHDPESAWQIEHAVDRTLSQMELPPEQPFEQLSSGMKRRVLLAAAIAARPDILLLDEPTNHLDMPSILWLEQFLVRYAGTLIFITHDRTFLTNLATRIWEIDRGRLFDWSCDYATFLQRKEAALAAQEKQDALFDKKLAQEEVWIRQGIKARRTRNEGRVRALKKMREQRGERRKVEGTAKLNLQQAQNSGALVADLKNVSFAYDSEQPILTDFSSTIMRGDKVGIMGRNGAGKTTLLRLLLGDLKPDAGKVRLGTRLEVAYFDQLRDTLDAEKSVQENIGEGSDRIQIGDQTKHIIGYLQDFLFTPDRARTPVKFLSGGERNRALLAKLMTRPANVIVLDEPTNDLDSETLEMLEEQLTEFAGTILMVSHDRTFLNNVVTSTIVFEDGGAKEYVGGYDEWLAVDQRRKAEAEKSASRAKADAAAKPPAGESPTAPVADRPARKLSYKEKSELEELPTRIETLESEIARLHQSMADPEYFKSPPEKLTADSAELKRLESDLADAFTRWEQLEAL